MATTSVNLDNNHRLDNGRTFVCKIKGKHIKVPHGAGCEFCQMCNNLLDREYPGTKKTQ